MPTLDTALPAVAEHLAEQAERNLERADSKAFSLAAGATATLALLLPRLPVSRDGRADVASWSLVVGAAAWCVGIVVLTVAVYPRLLHTGRALFFGDLATDFDRGEVRDRVRAISTDPESWLLDQAHALGRIAVRKYCLIRIGMVLLGVGGIAVLAGLLLGRT